MRLAIVTNIPAPYRVPIYNLIAARNDVELHVFYAMEREPDRSWDLPEMRHAHTYLKGRMYTRSGRYIHDNPDVFDKLRAFQPGVVITTGFNPTQLYAFAWAWLNRRRHVAMTDGTDISEGGLSELHRKVRRFVFARSQAFIAASGGGRRLFRSYGVADSRVHISPLCANTTVNWDGGESSGPALDLLFSGRLVPIKNPSFFLQVARAVAVRLGRRITVGILGAGPLEQDLRDEAAAMRDHVHTHFAGHVRQADVPSWFLRSRLFLFPTSWDPWGVVANEACFAGLPVLVSPYAGVAHELIRDGENGRILPLDVHRWSEAAADILSSDELRNNMALQSRRLVAPYNFQAAAQGILDAAAQAMAPRVVCIQRRLTHYRVPLFELVRKRLAAQGVSFELVYGDAMESEKSKHDAGKLSWGIHVPCHYFFSGKLCWQNNIRTANGAALVILTQENKLLYNLLALTLLRPKRLAFWGHGRNFQARQEGRWRESFKRWAAVRSDWWFAYTGLSQRLVEDMGFRSSRISNLENAVDTHAFAALCDEVSPTEIAACRKQWQLGTGPMAIFVGSLYAEKRLEFLLEAGARMAAQVPGFHLMVIGDGQQRELVELTARSAGWLRYGGAQFGQQKAVCMRTACLMLNPGLVGLGILDAFAAGLPMVTTDCDLHSPEIDYLRSGINGLMTADSINAYVDASSKLLLDASTRERLGSAARMDAAHFTVENMAERFCDGVLAAMKLPLP